MDDMETTEHVARLDASTDSIIEELKALAKSMLESTEAVRRRTRNVEICKSYEALLSGLEAPLSATRRPLGSTLHQTRHPNDDISISEKCEDESHADRGAADKLFPKEHSTGDKRADQRDFIEDGPDRVEDNYTDMDADVGNGIDGCDDVRGVSWSGESKNLSVAGTAAVDCSADSEENVYDGVKTHVVFKAVDPALYDEISGCTWQPEPLRLHTETGETFEDCSDDEDVEENGAEEGIRGTTVKVFRVPSFPFGGGITEAQAHSLSRLFANTIRRGGLSTSIKPLHITKSQFIGYECKECATTEEQRASFKPISPFEFVVEVERSVVFDAVRAREERRREFRRLAKDGKAHVTMGSFNLRVIMDPLKTGFEEEKIFPIERGTIVAGRYQIIELLGKATFSRAVRCYDLHQPLFEEEEGEEDSYSASHMEKNDTTSTERPDRDGRRRIIGYAEVCLKIINNSKDFFDQSLDEIRLLTLINKHKDPDAAHVIRLIDCFYYKEHTMLVTELLSDNLYEYSKFNREGEDTFYFTIPRIRRIARQIVEALAYVHSLNLIHADLKPENILFVSHRRCIIKVIDFGSSCFLSDHLSSYIQSRSYRAPEVILGCDYDGRIDVWSLGAILVELVTGDVLFTSETVPEMLARIVSVCGQPLPRRMLWEGRHTSKFINKFGCIFEQGNKDGGDSGEDSSYYYIYTPTFHSSRAKIPEKKNGSPESEGNGVLSNNEVMPSCEGPYGVLRQKLAVQNVTDGMFLSFVEACLTLDHKKRPTSEELLMHPFLTHSE